MANYNTPLMLLYKGFRLHKAPTKGGPHKVRYMLKVGNYHLPRKFEWTDINNVFAFKKYIDALVFRDVLESKKYEDEEYAINHEYETYEGKAPLVTICPMRLAQIIFAEDPLELPADTIVRLRSAKSDEKSTRFVPYEFMAELANEGITPDMLHAVIERAAAGFPVTAKPFTRNSDIPGTESKDIGTKKNAKEFPREHPCNNTGGNLTWASEMDGQRYEKPARKTLIRAIHQGGPPEPEPERFLETKMISQHAYKVFSIAKHENTPYFIRRIMHVKGFVMLTQTSWHMEGPWHTVHKDSVELASEGLTEEDAA